MAKSANELKLELRRELERRGLDPDAAEVKAGRTHFTVEDGNVTDLAIVVAAPVPRGVDPVEFAADKIVEAAGHETGEDDEGAPESRADKIRAKVHQKYGDDVFARRRAEIRGGA